MKVSRLLTVFSFIVMMAGGSVIQAQNIAPDDIPLLMREQSNVLLYQKLLEEHAVKQQEDLYKKPQKFVGRELIPTKSLQTLEKSVSENKTGFVIQHIHIKNITVLPQKTVHTLIKPYEGKWMSLEDIVVLAKTLTNEYLKRGYITCRITVPEQNLASGNLELVAVEGKIENIIMVRSLKELEQVSGNAVKKWTLKEATVFPWREGRIAQLKDLEQGIDQLNRLRSHSAEMSIMPSETEGGSTVVILTNEAEKKAWATAQVDTGAFGSNNFRPGTGFSMEDIFGLNESVFFNLTDEGQYTKNNSKSRIISMSIPLGYWGVSGQYSSSSYLNRIQGKTKVFNNTGQSTSYVLASDYVISRGAHYKVSVFAQYCGQDTSSQVDGVANTASSFKVTVIRTGMNHAIGTRFGSFSTSFGYHRGVSWSGASSDASDITDGDPHAQFEKYVLLETFTRPSIWKNWPVSWTSSVQMQYAKKSLYSSERMGVGGIFSVRGTHESLNGERGILIRNDVSVRLADLWNKPIIRNHSAGMTVDGAYVWSKDRYAAHDRGGTISAGLTLNGRKDNIWWGFSYSFPIKGSSFLEAGSGQFNATTGVEF